MTVRTPIRAILALSSFALFTTPAFAQVTANLNVSATVADNCAISTAPVAFGNVNVTAASAPTASGSITVKCTNGTGWVATASLGGNASGSNRRMVHGTDASKFLTYELFRDSGYSNSWGSASAAGFSGTGSGSDQVSTVYARIPTGQNSATLGAYSDVVTVTLTYP